MPTISAAIWFATVAFLMALSPGPNLIYLASRSICQGRCAGFSSLAGVCAAMFLYMLATSAGLSALFDAVPIAYDAVHWAGTAYLLWLAFKVITKKSPSLNAATLLPESNRVLFCHGFLTCFLNPKVVVMYGALLPQFVEPSVDNVVSQTVALGVVQIAAAATAHSLVILTAASVASVLSRHHPFAGVQRYLLGTVLAALAVRLVTEHRAV